jgi:acyl-coenzyme A thioesterase PaaI-like protein
MQTGTPLWTDESVITALGAVRLAAMPFHASMMGIEWLEYGPVDFVPRVHPSTLTVDSRDRIAPIPLATLLDMMLGHAARGVATPATRILTMNLAVQLTRDLPVHGSVTGRASVTSRGDHVIATTGELTDSTGQVLGTARGMFIERPIAKSSSLAPATPTAETKAPQGLDELDPIERAVFDERQLRARTGPHVPSSSDHATDYSPDHPSASFPRSFPASFSGHDWYVGLEHSEPGENENSRVVLPTALYMRNRSGFVQGGIIAGLLYAAASAATDGTFRLADYTCTYLRPGQVGGPPITAVGHTRYAGGRSMCVTVDASQVPGTDLAVATALFVRD